MPHTLLDTPPPPRRQTSRADLTPPHPPLFLPLLTSDGQWGGVSQSPIKMTPPHPPP